MGPTEFRLIIIIANILLMYVPALTAYHGSFSYFGETIHYGTLDIIGIGILAILCVFYFVSFFKDLHWFAQQDPLPKHPKNGQV